MVPNMETEIYSFLYFGMPRGLSVFPEGKAKGKGKGRERGRGREGKGKGEGEGDAFNL